MPGVRPATARRRKIRTLRRFYHRDQPSAECVVIRAGALSTEEPRWPPSCTCPPQHDEADLVLAGLIAELVDSAELYVTWTAAEGPATPAIPAVLREPPVRRGTLLMRALRELWAALRNRPPRDPAAPARRAAPRERAA